MDLDALIALVASERQRILPFVGSGMTLASGAPTVAALARDLARRASVPCDPDRPNLTTVTRDAEDRLGTVAVQQHVAEIFSGRGMRAARSAPSRA